MKRLLLPPLLFFTFLLFSQSEVDSLLNALKTMEDDSLKVQTYLNLTIQYIRIDQNIALDYANRAKELADRLGLRSSVATARYRKGTVLRNMDLYDQALEEFMAAKTAYSTLADTIRIAFVQVEMGRLAQHQSKNEEALTLYLEALKLLKKTSEKNSMARIHNFIGTIYERQKQYDKAIENYESALSLVKELKFTPGISACLTNLGNVHAATKEYEKALSNYREALELKKETGDKLGISRVLENIGNVYNIQEKFNLAEEYLTQALELAREVGNSRQVSEIQSGLAISAFRKGNFSKSIQMYNEALVYIDSSNNLALAVKVHSGLSQAYKKNGNLEKALEHALIKSSLSDSLYNKNILSVTNDLEAKYQNDQKNKEIANLELERRVRESELLKGIRERNLTMLFVVFTLLLAGPLLYYQYHIKQKANKKLRELDRLKSNFFANISHEFRTPLTLIKGPIERLEQNPDEPLNMDTIKMIRRNSNRVLKLVNQLLDLSKIDEGNLKLEPTEGDVYKCLRAATSSFNSHAIQRNMDYRVRIPQNPLWASFDRDKLEKVVYNLLSNAFKFSDNGAHISFETEYAENELKIQVSDSGKGIPEKELPFIFDRFFQVDSSATKEEEGSGIGLSLSRNLVELMDGIITVTSKVGQGSVFVVRLPMEEIRTGQEEWVTGTEEVTRIASRPESFELTKDDKRDVPRILLVEDNADMRHFIKENLVRHYKVSEAINGVAGLKKALAHPPDLIITDLMMPKMDGITLCNKLKTNVNTSHIPVIILTAKAGMDNKLEGLEIGADDYIVKPFDANELIARSKNLIEQRKKLRELYGNAETGLDPKKITVTSIDQKFLEQVLAMLEECFSDPDFGVPQMQQTLGMSKTQLHRKIKALTNETPGELLRNFRLKRAAQLLSQKADSVTQIAYRVGFNNLSYFAKCFKELYGVAPSSY